MRRGVVQPLLAEEPELAADVVFGIRASTFLAERFGDRLLSAWAEAAPRCGRPCLRSGNRKIAKRA